MQQFPFTAEEWETCLKVLEAMKADPFNNPDNQRFKTLLTLIHKKAKKAAGQERIAIQRQEDAAQLRQTAHLSKVQANQTLFSPEPREDGHYSQLHYPQNCYCCSREYLQLHFHYHKLCPDCAELNYSRRHYKAELTGYQVVLTGGRVKIGYATALSLLRAGARVLLTTRFPALALQQFTQEPDYEQWENRLDIYGLDLRNLKAVYAFSDHCKTQLPQLDVLINNAAQTIKYPLEYYLPLIQQEQKLLSSRTHASLSPNETPLSLNQDQWLETTALPTPSLNRFGQPVDSRSKNSWNATLSEIGLEELLEVNLINHISPYLLISELGSLMENSPNQRRAIVNVSSSEGQFNYPHKTRHHPHTNMTKAALNMLTRTSAQEYVEKGIYMNAIDVGWVSTGATEEKRSKLFDQLRIPPLDPVDGAMRIVHALSEILSGKKDWHGVLLKDYQVAGW